MDAGLLGGLIGVGVMVCGACLCVVFEKGGDILKTMRKKIARLTTQKQALPLATTNPLLVRVQSKQFQMKELLPSKEKA
jgi:hypothetical protein